jgi:predicted dehydrogenase
MTNTPGTTDTPGLTGPLGVAIVGCGIIGLNHARAILRHPGLAIVALVDAVPAAAEALAETIVADGGVSIWTGT